MARSVFRMAPAARRGSARPLPVIVDNPRVRYYLCSLSSSVTKFTRIRVKPVNIDFHMEIEDDCSDEEVDLSHRLTKHSCFHTDK